MTLKVDEEQMDFLNDLMGDTPDTSKEVSFDEHAVVDEVVEPAETVVSEETVGEQEDNKEQKDEEPINDINATLREQIVKLTEQLQSDPYQQSVATDVKTDEDKVKEAVKELPKTLQAFLSEDELDRIIDEPKLLNTAFERAVGVMQQNMNVAIRNEVNRQVMVSKAVSDFYSTNQDLIPYAKFVKFVMSEVEQANPQKTYGEIFETTADEARKRLGLGQQVRQQGQVVQTNQKPAFAGSKKSTARPAPKQDFFDQNAADMFNLS